MAQRATSLGPKPSLFIIFVVFFCLFLFLSFLCFVIQKNLVFPLEKGILCILSVSLCFSLPFFGLPLFQCFFLCLSLLLVIFSFPSCLSFLLSFGSLFLSLSFLFFLLCFCFMKGTTSNSSIPKFSFINLFCFLVSCLLFSLKSFFFLSLFFFADFKLCFCSTSLFWVSKKQVEKHQFLVKRGVATKRCFL